MLTIGYCPHCNSEVRHRTRGGSTGRDTCVRGHVYPSLFTLTHPLNEWVRAVRETLETVRDFLQEQAFVDSELNCPVNARQNLEMASRCQRTLEAVPLARVEAGAVEMAAEATDEPGRVL